ncbi:hypothetical protein [Paenibacillus odorifer]|uniref:hypothetical protein n=1 Tax=Paenibacillus odorifer TaxID=189426 RepID=UPI00096C6D1E|nr:hypothetical protein [Paenibacillus odorifer]OME41414.1 hypothetical protein BSK58_14875 [Paenibacillus odorifer]
MKKVVGSFLVTSLLFTSPAFATPQAQVKTVSVTQNQSIRNNIFNLSDQQIKNAISIGKKDYSAILAFEKTQRLTIIQDTMKINQPEVLVFTPYLGIVRQSFLKFDNYEDYSLADAKKLVSVFSKSGRISFEVMALGNNIDFAETINIVLKQGDKILQPVKINGKDDYARRSTSWPDSPAYINPLTANFDIKQIDFSKPAELIYLYAGKELSVTYKVDFSRIK